LKPGNAKSAAMKTLHDPRVPFCHREATVIDEDMHAWCDVTLERNPSRRVSSPDVLPCPAWKAICARPPGKATKLLHHQEEQEVSESFAFPSHPAVAWILRFLLVALVLALIVVLLRLGRVSSERASNPDLPGQGEPMADRLAQERLQQVETDVQRLLARAAAAAAAGHFSSACNDAYAALLRRLEGLGLWQVEPHLTNGDMLRAVTRPKPALEPELKALVRDIEIVQFSQEPASRERFESVWERVQHLLRQGLVLWLMSFPALFLLGSCSCQPGGDADQWNESPSGHADWVPFLNEYGFDARERVAPLHRLAEKPDQKKGGHTAGAPHDGKKGHHGTKTDKVAAEPDALILLPTARVDETEWKAIEHWLLRAPHLLVVAGPSRERVPWKQLEGLDVAQEGVGPGDAEGVVAGVKHVIRLPHTRTLQGTSGSVALAFFPRQGVYGRRITLPLAEAAEKDSDVYVRAEHDGTEHGSEQAEGHHGDEDDDDDEPPAPVRTSEVLVLADDDLFANASLMFPDNARAATEILRQWGPRVELVTDVASLVADSPAQAVQRSGFGPAFLQLALLLLLAFIARGAIFGTPRDLPEPSRRAFVEHVRAIGALYQRAGHARRAMQVFASFVVERLRARHGMAGGRSLSSLAEAVAARTGQPLGHVMGLLVEARGAGTAPAAEEGSSSEDKEALARLRELASLLQEKGDTIERR